MVRAAAQPGWLRLLSSHMAPARAEPPDVVEPSAEKGQTLAERLCSGCHVVETASKTVPAGIPPLWAIANLPGQSATRIMNVLIQPHAPMPDMQLSRQEILDITAYLDTAEVRRPSLLPPKQGNQAEISRAVLMPTSGSEVPRNLEDGSGGESGIRTHETVARLHAFQACAFQPLGHLSVVGP